MFMYCSSPKLCVIITAAAAATMLLLTMANFHTMVVVDAKTADTTIMKGPDCFRKSPGKEYNDRVAHLIEILVRETKEAGRNIQGDREFNHSYPNRNAGSPFGVATCYMDIGKDDCRNCLTNIKDRLSVGCLHPVAATLTLQDCSMWFNAID